MKNLFTNRIAGNNGFFTGPLSAFSVKTAHHGRSHGHHDTHAHEASCVAIHHDQRFAFGSSTESGRHSNIASGGKNHVSIPVVNNFFGFKTGFHQLECTFDGMTQAFATHTREIQCVEINATLTDQTTLHSHGSSDPRNRPTALFHLFGHSQTRHHMTACTRSSNNQMVSITHSLLRLPRINKRFSKSTRINNASAHSVMTNDEPP